MTAETASIEVVPAGDVSPGRRHALELTAAKFLAAGLSAGWLFVAARELPLAEFGDLTLLLALGVIAVQLADAGVSIRLPAAVTADPAAMAPLARRGARIRASWAVVAAAVAVAAFAAGGDGPVVAAVVFGGSVVATAAHNAFGSAFRSVGRVRLEATTDVLARAGVAATGAALVLGGHGVVALAAVYAVADVAVLGAFAVVARRTGVRGVAAGALPWSSRRPLAFAIPLATVYWRIDVWLLAVLSTSTEVALYGAAYRLLDAALLAPLTIASLALPRVSAPGADVPREVGRWGGVAVLSVLPFTFVALVAAAPVLRLLFGSAYGEASTMLVLLGLAAVPSAVALVGTQAAAQHDPRRYSFGVVTALVLSVAACVAFLGDGGGVAAAAITLAGQSAYAVYQVALVRSRRVATP